MRRIFVGVAVAAVALISSGMLAGGTSQALAYGNAGDAQQIYQLEFSGNCNNADFCGGELGGFWGWAVLYDDGTGEAEIAFCGMAPTSVELDTRTSTSHGSRTMASSS